MRLIGKILLWLCAGTGALVLVTVLAVVAFTASVRDRAPDLPESAVLTLDWNGTIPEYYATKPLFEPVPPATLLETVQTIEAAAAAPEIKAIAVYLGDEPLGFARAEELADAIRRFRASGKKAYAYSYDLAVLGDGTPEIMLAAAFDEVWMQPSGMVGLTGVALEVPYFADGLDKLGVEAEFEQRHEFKGGADPMTRSGMSEPVRQSLTDLARGMLDTAVRSIATDRGLREDVVHRLVDTGPFLAEEAVSVGLIDRLDYAGAFEAWVDEQVGGTPDWVEVPLVRAALADKQEQPADARVAVLFGIGPIGVDGSDPFSENGFDATGLTLELEDIAANGGYDAVLLRVDSPGGAYGPSDEVWNAVQMVRDAGIPVVVSMGDMAASGGYFVSVAADHIVARESTITGSIGVYGGKFNANALWDKLGVNWEQIAVGRNSGMWSMNRPFDADEKERFARSIDFVYTDFTSKVAAARGLDATALDAAARGRVWTGAAAKDVGLVDELGGYDAALNAVRRLLTLDATAALELTVLPEPASPWDALMKAARSGDFSPYLMDKTTTGIVASLEKKVGGIGLLTAPRGMLSAPPVRIVR